MAQPTTQIPCPNCNTPVPARIEQLLDAGQDPSAKTRLLSGSLNRLRCPACGFEGQAATPLVYHDPEKELLLTFTPMELNLNKDEQEKIIGQIINHLSETLPAEQRKAYLLQPQSALTMQGLIDQVLEADGITKEEIEAQRAKMRLFEQFLRIPDEQVESFVEENDDSIDSTFFQLAQLTLQSTPDANAQAALAAKLDQLIELSSFGEQLKEQEDELRQASETLQALGDELTRERLLELFVEAPNDTRLIALVNLTRPALDYNFFQMISDRIEQAEGEEKERLDQMRQKVLETTQQIDEVQQARAEQSAGLLRSILQAPDLDQAIQSALPAIDDLFIAILQANIEAAKERDDQGSLKRLQEVDEKLKEIIQGSVPPSLKLAQDVLEAETEEQALELLEQSSDQIDEQIISALMSAVNQMRQQENQEDAEKFHRLYQKALKLSMSAKMKS
jgi:hypothetical protein